MRRTFFATILTFYVLVATSSAQIEPARVDFDADGTISFEDFILFAGQFEGSHPTYDIDWDGIVQFGDFIEFTGQFNEDVLPVGDWRFWRARFPKTEC